MRLSFVPRRNTTAWFRIDRRRRSHLETDVEGLADLRPVTFHGTQGGVGKIVPISATLLSILVTLADFFCPLRRGESFAMVWAKEIWLLALGAEDLGSRRVRKITRRWGLWSRTFFDHS